MNVQSVVEEDKEERCDEVVDALDVSGGRVSDSPDVKYPFEDLLDGSLLKEANYRTHPGNVDVDLAVGVAVNVVVLGGEVLLDVPDVFVPFTGHHVL